MRNSSLTLSQSSSSRNAFPLPREKERLDGGEAGRLIRVEESTWTSSVREENRKEGPRVGGNGRAAGLL